MTLLRFAPSPTGSFHLGGLRTALFNHLYARKRSGKWLLRLEDTDRERSHPMYVGNIRESLEWAGLNYDYGPGANQSLGPYTQSERLDLYLKYSNKLLDSGHAYRCFCSKDRMADVREKLARLGSNETYDKACLHLTEEEVARRVKAGEKHVVRLNNERLPKRPEPADIIFGQLKDAHLSLPTDPILVKTDLFPTYHLASVVDDHEMGITHVLRGEEWLTSLPLHLDLYACLDLKPPQFGHVPILLNADGTKMSKRGQGAFVNDYMREGWEPSSVLNWLALTGWGAQHDPSASVQEGQVAGVDANVGVAGKPQESVVQQAPDSTAIFTMDELINQFDVSALTHRRTVLDSKKLEYLNHHFLMRALNDPHKQKSLADDLGTIVKEALPGCDDTALSHDYLQRVVRILSPRVTRLRDVVQYGAYFFKDPDYRQLPIDVRVGLNKISAEDAELVLSTARAALAQSSSPISSTQAHDLLQEAMKLVSQSISKGVFQKVLRVWVTGVKDGPPLYDTIEILGREKTLGRLEKFTRKDWEALRAPAREKPSSAEATSHRANTN